LLAAHNVPVERSVLCRHFPLHQFGPWIDTLKLARGAFPDLRSKSLSELLDALSLTARVRALCPGLEPHDACYDAVGCACILEHFLSLPGWRDLEVEAFL
jgi:DNA polymerase-3 subunit epsilon